MVDTPFPAPSTQTIVKTAKTYARDLAERVVSTGLQAFVGGLVLTQPFDIGMWQAAGVAGVAAATSLVKGMAARAFGAKNSASLARDV